MSDFTLEVITTEQQEEDDFDESEESMNDATMQQLFMLFDTDNSGTISIDELKSVLKSLGQNPNRAELQAMMEEVDCDGKKIAV